VSNILPLDQPRQSARLVSYQPWRGTDPWLIGHAAVDFDGWIINRIPVFRRKDGTLNVGVPDTVVTDRDGTARKVGGRLLHASLITFSDDAAKARWKAAVLAALAEGSAP
jgi:hypothetical protein